MPGSDLRIIGTDVVVSTQVAASGRVVLAKRPPLAFEASTRRGWRLVLASGELEGTVADDALPETKVRTDAIRVEGALAFRLPRRVGDVTGQSKAMTQFLKVMFQTAGPKWPGGGLLTAVRGLSDPAALQLVANGAASRAIRYFTTLRAMADNERPVTAQISLTSASPPRFDIRLVFADGSLISSDFGL